MIKNKGLNFLLTLLEAVILILIVNFIDLACNSNGAFILGTLASSILWLGLLINKDFLENGDSNFRIFIYNASIVVTFIISFIFLLILGLSFFSEVPGGSLVAATSMISTVIAYLLVLYCIGDDYPVFLEYSIFVPAGIAVASFVLSAVISLLGGVATIIGIVLLVGCVVATIIAFKTKHIQFESFKSKYVPSSPSATKSDNEKKINKNTPEGAMKAIARKFSGEPYTLAFALATQYATIDTKIANGTVTFEVEIEIRLWKNADAKKLTANMDNICGSRSEQAWKELCNDITREYESETDRLMQAGVNCSSIGKMRITNTETFKRFGGYTEGKHKK